MEHESKFRARNAKLTAIHYQTLISIASGFALVALAILSAIFGILAVNKKAGGFSLDNLALLGSFLQGSVASLFAFAGLCFIYAAFLRQGEQLMQQETETEHQKEQFERQLRSAERHQMLSVTPHIVASLSKVREDNGLAISYDLCNHGIGPAKIRSITLLLDGKPFPAREADPMEAFIAVKLAGKVKYRVSKSSYPRKGYTIIPGQLYRLIEICIATADLPDSATLSAQMNGMDIRVEYESFYEVIYVFDTRVDAGNEKGFSIKEQSL